MVVRVFMSHTKWDKKFCDKFDVAAARVGVRVFRSEYETIEPPAWKTIKEQMDASSAMFLLVGEMLVKAQAASAKDSKWAEYWKHTQNWIAYEIGLACERGIDVWVCCDGVEINFPVPYLNNYEIYGKLKFIREVLEVYAKGHNFPIGRPLYGYTHIIATCPHKECGAEFNLHSVVKKKGEVKCPTCLKNIFFPEGWLLR